MKKKALMIVAIGFGVISSLIAIYDRFGDDDEADNLPLLTWIPLIISMILMTFAGYKKKKN